MSVLCQHAIDSFPCALTSCAAFRHYRFLHAVELVGVWGWSLLFLLRYQDSDLRVDPPPYFSHICPSQT